MKKVLLFILTIFVFIACEGPMGMQGPTGPQGEPGYGTNWYTTAITIDKSEWKLMGNPNELNSYYYVDKPFKELTRAIFDNGSVIAYIETAEGVKNGMPMVLHKAEEDELGEFFWTQTYDFDFYPNGISFYLTYSDFSTKIKPDSETFHIVLIW
ncbi:hypothetical protein JGH11_10495 [Dysgonomonas sp. Marseille-P4677]|uniref:hypothetical protein n=1 Tax=Dysgonomonas sp. Marseille-P4677 TaxID=2364790 RepID=UPI0019142C6A|nr:hypothetical protein [Dysgonomonas sp. Marseille-P4677]MBK5721300.1 hypothetical protein [Dysgonomonas sp. Marseille-P4677]